MRIIVIMTKSLTSLFNTSFPLTNCNHTGEAGNLIEKFLGGTINSKSEADLGFWEIKSRNIEASSSISLGSKKTLIEAVNSLEAKIKNVIFAYYLVRNNIAIVQYVNIFVGLKNASFEAEIGKKILVEKRGGRNTLRVYPHNLPLFYDKVTNVTPH